MRHSAQTFFGYEFAGFTADAVSLVFYADEGGLQVLNEFHLTFCQTA